MAKPKMYVPSYFRLLFLLQGSVVEQFSAWIILWSLPKLILKFFPEVPYIGRYAVMGRRNF